MSAGMGDKHPTFDPLARTADPYEDFFAYVGDFADNLGKSGNGPEVDNEGFMYLFQACGLIQSVHFDMQQGPDLEKAVRHLARAGFLLGILHQRLGLKQRTVMAAMGSRGADIRHERNRVARARAIEMYRASKWRSRIAGARAIASDLGYEVNTVYGWLKAAEKSGATD